MGLRDTLEDRRMGLKKTDEASTSSAVRGGFGLLCCPPAGGAHHHRRGQIYHPHKGKMDVVVIKLMLNLLKIFSGVFIPAGVLNYTFTYKHEYFLHHQAPFFSGLKNLFRTSFFALRRHVCRLANATAQMSAIGDRWSIMVRMKCFNL